jgi:hypothetical protein
MKRHFTKIEKPLESRMITSFCSSKSTAFFSSLDVSLVHIYRSVTGANLATIVVNQDDCRQ